MTDDIRRFPHIFLGQTGRRKDYTSPRTGRDRLVLPTRPGRQQHGASVNEKLQAAWQQAQQRMQQRQAATVDAPGGTYLLFKSEPEFELALKSLDSPSNGIWLLMVKEIAGEQHALVFVEPGGFTRLFKLIGEYLHEDSQWGKPKNRKLLESISDIRAAAVEGLWNESELPFPAEDETIWWEVWLRIEDAAENAADTLTRFKDRAEPLGLQFSPSHPLVFPDRLVTLIRGTAAHLALGIELFDFIAELRKAKETAEVFVTMAPTDQALWVANLGARVQAPAVDAPAVCLLDTGVAHAHPLLAPAVAQGDVHVYHPNWPAADQDGHGTGMAGLALYGNLMDALLSSSPVVLNHRLESVKILQSSQPHDAELYGSVTEEAVYRAEIQAPDRRRAVCLPVCTTDFRDRGQPSSWSAAIDKLCSGADDDVRRLLLIAAGNVPRWLISAFTYPALNETEQIHDPGQSWNAITVGAYTELTRITEPGLAGWSPIAPAGDLSPSSTTSLTWQRTWPMKPDFVLEGGNWATDPAGGQTDCPESLSLLTTDRAPHFRSFVGFGDTSGATALGARMAAILHHHRPNYWPETVRALLVHSAEWTPQMLIRLQRRRNGGARAGSLVSRALGSAWGRDRDQINRLLRVYGFGVANLERALWCSTNALTLVVQDELHPFGKKADGKVGFRDMQFHQLPWPTDALAELGDLEVEMRVTLSYFIEPNPGRRGWKYSHRYASHGLRFEVKKATETIADFEQRLNKAARDEEEGLPSKGGDSREWLLGSDERTRGSIHSDIWRGTAADLASRGCLGVFPVVGWWRERHQLGRYNRPARYSLVVTIKTPPVELDIYTPVAQQIGLAIEV